MSSELETLASAVCDGRASDVELARLAELLRDDPVLRDQYLRYADIHSALSDETLPAFESDLVDYRVGGGHEVVDHKLVDLVKNPSVRGSLTRPTVARTARQMAVATAAVLVVTLGFLAIRNSDGERSRKPSALAAGATSSNPRLASSAQLIGSMPIATVLLSEKCRWKGAVVSEGDRLNAGLVELDHGTAVLRFDGGAEIVLVGPAAIDLNSAGSVRVRLGNVVVRATDGAEGFIVTTPTSEVVDLGTEFAVKVRPSGTTEVHVLEGEVSYRGLNTSDELAKILRAGEGVAIDSKGRPSAVPMNSPRFQEFIRRINPRTRVDLLTAYEGFNYSPGVLPLSESTVGKGWAGPWRKRLPHERTLPADDLSPDHFEIVHGEMNVTWPVPGGRLDSLKLPAGGAYYVRPMNQPMNLNRDGVAFFSLMVRETERRTDSDRPRERLRLTFRSTQDYDGQAISFGHGPGYRPTVKTGSGIAHTSPFVLPPEQTTLWIGKVVSRQHGEDEIFFRVYGEDDVLDYAEPATWHVVTRGVELNASLDLVLLSSEGKTARVVDELRIGPTWRSVAPMMENAE